MRSLNEWILAWPRSREVWSIHVDELSEWRPSNMSYAAWAAELVGLWELAKQLLQGPGVVVAAISFEASERLETFQHLLEVPLDSFTPPSLYLLNEGLEFPAAGEQYYRVVARAEVSVAVPDQCAVIARSARSIQGMENSWEFDNTLYFASKFGE